MKDIHEEMLSKWWQETPGVECRAQSSVEQNRLRILVVHVLDVPRNKCNIELIRHNIFPILYLQISPQDVFFSDDT